MKLSHTGLTNSEMETPVFQKLTIPGTTAGGEQLMAFNIQNIIVTNYRARGQLLPLQHLFHQPTLQLQLLHRYTLLGTQLHPGGIIVKEIMLISILSMPV